VNRVFEPGNVGTAGQASQAIWLQGNDSDIKTDYGQPCPHHVDLYFLPLYFYNGLLRLIKRVSDAAIYA